MVTGKVASRDNRIDIRLDTTLDTRHSLYLVAKDDIGRY